MINLKVNAFLEADVVESSEDLDSVISETFEFPAFPAFTCNLEPWGELILEDLRCQEACEYEISYESF